MKEQESVSSPTATGGGGTFFEQHVDALFLALLLVRGIPPILKDSQVEEVHVQSEHLGWKTDDLVIVGTRGTGRRCHLAAQVKRQFTISSSNEDCKKAFLDFWSDFKSNDKFDPETDSLALITLRGTDTLLRAFNSLLDCARASTDGADLARRLATKGYLSQDAQRHAITIRTIIEESGGEDPSENDLWRFLRVLHVLSFDLNTSTAQNEAWIKSLLAHTSSEPDPLAAAEATWRELLEIVGQGMPAAASYTYSSLPEKLRARHTAVATSDNRALRALTAHCETTLNGIHTMIAGTVRIHRDALATRILECLDESQVAVVTGPAGSGKSALAKNAVELLSGHLFCLAFRAEEFATSHIDQTLQQAQASINAQRLLALLAAQGRKVILVESVERLLEASVRDAFSDLLRLVHQDRSIQLVLSCRDYSVDTVRTSLLDPATLGHTVVEVPPLTDDELSQVVQTVPQLRRAVENPSLRKLLRSPYMLDKAARMDWSETRTLPGDERAFRVKCWNEVVRHDAIAGAGLPRRREQAFLEIALRRARALSPYVQCDDLDAGAIEELRKDDLVVVSKEGNAFAASAHDVLEDWAIIQWLAAQFSHGEDLAGGLAEIIGGYPAIRRGYRKWLAELLECETERADAFVLSSFRDESLPAYFRDDTLVCTMLSSTAADFFARQREVLLADQGRLLIRVIHLLRVACKTAPSWLPPGVPVASQLLIPKGDAWAAVLKITNYGADYLLPANRTLLLGLLEDWAGLVTWETPEPDGFAEAGSLAFALLAHAGGYRRDDFRKRLLTVIASIPRANTSAFEDLLRRGCALGRDDVVISDLAEILLTGIYGSVACRDFPELMVRFAIARFCLSDEDLRGDRINHAPIDTELYFGLREHLDFFPSSAIRGPFLPLLRSDPTVGVKFIIKLLNHAATWYGEQRWPYDRLEPARRLTLDIPGEGQVMQWANPRLWSLYRGTSVGPCVLETALMALELWLLEICEIENVNVEPWLLRLLKDSNNIAVIAVVASVCNAHPAKGGRAALALLTARELIGMDRGRMISDYSSLAGLFPFYDAEKMTYDGERKKSNSLPHRRHDLETLALKLQLGGQSEEVWEILDRHRAALPPIEEQSEDHRLWRLALHRMDIRGFRPVEPVPEAVESDAAREGDSEERGRIYYGPGAIEEDVQELIDRHAPVSAQWEADLSLLNWGRSVWERSQSSGIDISTWPSKLVEAKERDRDPREAKGYSREGPCYVAAVCARDHWNEMEGEDREWCVVKLIGEIDQDCDTDDNSVRHARGAFTTDRYAAYVLPRVLSESTPEDCDPRIRAAVGRALTHSVPEVVAYAAEGVGQYLQGVWLDFAKQCVGAVARQARLLDELQTEESSKPFPRRRRLGELTRNVVPGVRDRLEERALDADRELARLDLRPWSGQASVQTILQIVGYWTVTDLTIQFHDRVVAALIDIWSADQEDRYSRQRNYRFESDCSQRLARFVLKLQAHEALALCGPILAAYGYDFRDISQFLRFLVIEESGSDGKTPFWEVWQAFAERLLDMPWIGSLDSRSTAKDLVDVLFLGLEWKEGVRHWPRLEGQAQRIDALVASLPASDTVLEAYCRFLYDIGERSLPKGFVIVAERMSAGNASEILAVNNTVFYLESLLRRYVYGEPHRLKSNSQVRTAVLQILDDLVEAGSSASFRMRDDFVTPIGARP